MCRGVFLVLRKIPGEAARVGSKRTDAEGKSVCGNVTAQGKTL